MCERAMVSFLSSGDISFPGPKERLARGETVTLLYFLPSSSPQSACPARSHSIPTHFAVDVAYCPACIVAYNRSKAGSHPSTTATPSHPSLPRNSTRQTS